VIDVQANDRSGIGISCKTPQDHCYYRRAFSLQFTKNSLAAGLRPDPLGELERSPRPRSRKIEGLILRGEEMSDGIGGEGKGWRERGFDKKGGEEKGGGKTPHECGLATGLFTKYWGM